MAPALRADLGLGTEAPTSPPLEHPPIAEFCEKRAACASH